MDGSSSDDEPPINFKILLLPLIIILGLLVSFIIGGKSLIIIFLLIVINKVVLDQLRINSYLGLEIITLVDVLTGIIYGPKFAFIFCFIALPILDILRFVYAPPLDVYWPPLLPSIESFVDGIIGAIAGIMSGHFSFLVILISCVILKSSMFMIKDKIIGESIFFLANILRVVFYLFLGIFIQQYIHIIFP